MAWFASRFAFAVVLSAFSAAAVAQRQMEHLGRGLVAVTRPDGAVYVGWRLLGTDPDGIGFNVYRTTAGGEAVKLNDKPISTSTNFTDAAGAAGRGAAYFVRPVSDGAEREPSASFRLAAGGPAPRLQASSPRSAQVSPASRNLCRGADLRWCEWHPRRAGLVPG